MKNKEKYLTFSSEETELPIFSKSWWLDATCGKDNWDVVIIEKDSKVVASWPYRKSKRAIFNVLSQPELTQKLGPYLKYPKNQKYEKRLSHEKKLIQEMASQLPDFDYFAQNLDYTVTNWLPLYWMEFDQQTQYTYVIDTSRKEEDIWNGLNNKTRTDIRNAKKKVEVVDSNDIQTFYDINKMTFERQNKLIPYSLSFVSRVDEACKLNGCRKILMAKDPEGQIHAAVYLIWDDSTVYYIMGGGDPKLRNSGAMHLLIWEAIVFASSLGRKFDFEGSMIEPVEKFVRSFGAQQQSYSAITKTNSKLLKIRQLIQGL